MLMIYSRNQMKKTAERARSHTTRNNNNSSMMMKMLMMIMAWM